MCLRLSISAVAVFAAMTVGVAHAQVNRCVDDHGKITFSDTVCMGSRAQKEFGVNSSAKGWYGEDNRPVRVAQNGSPAGGTPAGRPLTTIGTQPR